MTKTIFKPVGAALFSIGHFINTPLQRGFANWRGIRYQPLRKTYRAG